MIQHDLARSHSKCSMPLFVHREELQYHLDDDLVLYQADSKGRFDTPEHVCVFGDALRRLALFKGTRAAVKRRGFQTYARLIANASSAHCLQALSHEALGDVTPKHLHEMTASAKSCLPPYDRC